MAGMEILDLLLVVPLGLLAGGLAGLLGIGGGLIFAPLLLWMGLTPHQALATSTFACSGWIGHWYRRICDGVDLQSLGTLGRWMAFISASIASLFVFGLHNSVAFQRFGV